MGRILLLAMALYTFGDPSFDGRRPPALDRPLRDFRRSVDALPTDGPRVLAAIDWLRGKHALDRVLQSLNRSL